MNNQGSKRSYLLIGVPIRTTCKLSIPQEADRLRSDRTGYPQRHFDPNRHALRGIGEKQDH